ncbi:MAG: hypothetical protein WDW36_002225 [Sanguina aurantia]
MVGSWSTQVSLQDGSLALSICQQLLRECQLREEWRCGRESSLLVQLQLSQFDSLDNQMRTLPQAPPPPAALGSPTRTAQSLRSSSATSSSFRTATAAATAAATSAPNALVPRSSHRPTDGPTLSPLRTFPPTPTPTSPASHSVLPTLVLATTPHASHPRSSRTSKALLPHSPYTMPAAVSRSTTSSSTARRPSAPTPPSHHQQQQQRPSHTRPSVPSPQPQLRQHQQQPQSMARPSALPQNPYEEQGRSPVAATRHRAGPQGAHGRPLSAPLHHTVPAAAVEGVSARREEEHPGPGRFQQLLRLQGVLMQGLHEHKASDGASSAHSALLRNVVDGQQFFSACLESTRQQLGYGTPPVPHTASDGGSASVVLPPPGIRWMRHLQLQLGQLGLTRADACRLAVLRQSCAARVLQRSVRRWLLQRECQRAFEDAQRRTALLYERLRGTAAAVIQRCFRSHCADKREAAAARSAAELRLQRRLEALLRSASAARIQTAFRRFLRKRRYWAAVEQPQHGPSQPPPAEDGPTGPLAHVPAWLIKAGPPGGGGGVASRVLAAVVCIQAHCRGWRVRRGTSLWWARGLARVSARRRARGRWQRHQRAMAATWGLQEELVATATMESEASGAVVVRLHGLDADMGRCWDGWLSKQLGTAYAQPLPRHWIPHPSPVNGQQAFLNTRTGELHALHPSVSELHVFVEAQRQAANASLQQRRQGLLDDMEAVLQRCTAKQAALLQAVWQRSHVLTKTAHGLGGVEGGVGGHTVGVQQQTPHQKFNFGNNQML